MRPLLLTVRPPVVVADMSIAVSMELTNAPVSGVSVVLTAEIVPALLTVFRLPPWSVMASATRLKGAVAVAMCCGGRYRVGADAGRDAGVLANIDHRHIGIRSQDHTEGTARTDACHLGGNRARRVLAEFSASAITSSRGTVAKAPI